MLLLTTRQVNYVSPALLTDLLLPHMRATASAHKKTSARVLHISPAGHRLGVAPFSRQDKGENQESIQEAAWTGLAGENALKAYYGQRRRMLWGGGGGGEYEDVKLMVMHCKRKRNSCRRLLSRAHPHACIQTSLQHACIHHACIHPTHRPTTTHTPDTRR